MYKVVIIGSGKIGAAVAKLLHRSGDYTVCVADKDQNALERLHQASGIQVKPIDVTDNNTLASILKGQDAVVSAAPFYINAEIARTALKTGASYFDLTEDRETTKAIKQTAEKAAAGQIFMPQCGLAPGFISILTYELCKHFDQLDEVKMRVGALPQYPSNMMLYNLTWSTDGLINEYCNPCEAIHEHRLTETLALEGLELFSLDGQNYEAFNTSGGLATLCETLDGKVRTLNYKTVRYKGHRYLMDFLINGLNLGKRRELLKDILEHAVPLTKQDVTLIFCTVSGWINGKLFQESNARKIYNKTIDGEHWSSIQVTTAAAICAAVDLHANKKNPSRGFIQQETITLTEFLANRFGQHYNTPTEEKNPAITIESEPPPDNQTS